MAKSSLLDTFITVTNLVTVSLTDTVLKSILFKFAIMSFSYGNFKHTGRSVYPPRRKSGFSHQPVRYLYLSFSVLDHLHGNGIGHYPFFTRRLPLVCRRHLGRRWLHEYFYPLSDSGFRS